MKKFNVQKSA